MLPNLSSLKLCVPVGVRYTHDQREVCVVCNLPIRLPLRNWKDDPRVRDPNVLVNGGDIAPDDYDEAVECVVSGLSLTPMVISGCGHVQHELCMVGYTHCPDPTHNSDIKVLMSPADKAQLEERTAKKRTTEEDALKAEIRYSIAEIEQEAKEAARKAAEEAARSALIKLQKAAEEAAEEAARKAARKAEKKKLENLRKKHKRLQKRNKTDGEVSDTDEGGEYVYDVDENLVMIKYDSDQYQYHKYPRVLSRGEIPIEDKMASIRYFEDDSLARIEYADKTIEYYSSWQNMPQLIRVTKGEGRYSNGTPLWIYYYNGLPTQEVLFLKRNTQSGVDTYVVLHNGKYCTDREVTRDGDVKYFSFEERVPVRTDFANGSTEYYEMDERTETMEIVRSVSNAGIVKDRGTKNGEIVFTVVKESGDRGGQFYDRNANRGETFPIGSIVKRLGQDIGMTDYFRVYPDQTERLVRTIPVRTISTPSSSQFTSKIYSGEPENPRMTRKVLGTGEFCIDYHGKTPETKAVEYVKPFIRFYEGDAGEERVVKSVDVDNIGNFVLYQGEKGAEAMVYHKIQGARSNRVREYYYSGSKDKEALRLVVTNDAEVYLEGRKGEEVRKLVVTNGTEIYYKGTRDKEVIMRIDDDDTVIHLDGEQAQLVKKDGTTIVYSLMPKTPPEEKTMLERTYPNDYDEFFLTNDLIKRADKDYVRIRKHFPDGSVVLYDTIVEEYLRYNGDVPPPVPKPFIKPSNLHRGASPAAAQT